MALLGPSELDALARAIEEIDRDEKANKVNTIVSAPASKLEFKEEGKNEDGKKEDGKKEDGEEKRINPLDAFTIYEQHADPAVLKTDVCGYPDCHKPMEDRRFPCLACFGSISYCSEDCMWNDYSAHHRECTLRIKQATKNRKRIIDLRRKQLQKKGFTELVTHVMKNLDRDTLLENLMFIRMPIDPTEKITRDQKVKRVPRSGAAHVLVKNGCFQAAWKAWLKHLNANSDGTPHVYFLAYPPDTSFVFIVSVPYETDNKDRVKTDASDVEPMLEYIPCPCRMHSG